MQNTRQNQDAADSRPDAGSRVAILGASQGPGAALALQLAAAGRATRCLARSADKLALLQERATSLGLPPLDLRAGDATDPRVLAEAVAGADCIVNCIDGERRPELIDLLKPEPQLRFIMLGSARIRSRFPDARRRAIRALSEKVLARPWRATLVHPSMMYGWRRDNRTVGVVRRLLRFRVFPLPRGHPASVQPVHAEDVALGLLAVMQRDDTIGRELVFAGPEPLSYEAFLRQCAPGRVWLPRLPLWLLRLLAVALSLVRLGPTVSQDMLSRLKEERVFPDNDLPALGVQPRSFAAGLRDLSEI